MASPEERAPADHTLETASASESKQQNNHSPPVEQQDPFSGLSFKVGVAENKNATYRAKMEDVHTYVANFAEKLDWGYFAIFDGHAGKSTARWCGNNLHTLIEQELLAKEASANCGSGASPAHLCDVKDVFHNVFVKADELIEEEGSGSAGSTAAVAILRWESTEESAESGKSNPPKPGKKFDFVPGPHHKRMLYTSNVGDSRIVICRAGKAYRLTYDHKASDPSEIDRVRDRGGLIVKNRVNGVLAITRSLGDSYIKNLDEFLILACDGVWDVISDSFACKFVADIFKQQEQNKEPIDPAKAAKRLCQLAIDNATTDNVTAMVVKFDSSVLSAD
ncbi:uncharacterized protein CXQ87_000042 [Candidozyma duobushaemuli]|uniref:PPM-type phosphatase domain-containing protein n=1 Tax=Candidozyma duobushaemuli TaxID=1231522 RepID=A0A2V1AHI4_9ASCO|nr:uncharacterized protein CXQ87_000042 [[Candida] duobushaemulonis]PVH17162.1 hypothetical protein CXQ87_000042 [[Candida] duobushaemulonis]